MRSRVFVYEFSVELHHYKISHVFACCIVAESIRFLIGVSQELVIVQGVRF